MIFYDWKSLKWHTIVSKIYKMFFTYLVWVSRVDLENKQNPYPTFHCQWRKSIVYIFKNQRSEVGVWMLLAVVMSGIEATRTIWAVGQYRFHESWSWNTGKDWTERRQIHECEQNVHVFVRVLLFQFFSQIKRGPNNVEIFVNISVWFW